MSDKPEDPPSGWRVNRREFLRTSLVTGLMCLRPKFGLARSKPTAKEPAWGMLVDLSRCIGCRACSRACVNANNLPESPQDNALISQTPEILTYKKYSVVNAQSEGPTQRFVKQQCMHCSEPACVSVCPVGALDKTPSGPIIYRADRCIGCRYCMIACPFDVPRFEWGSGLKPVIGKCQFCAQQRIFEGLAPGCVESCPTGALKFGKRESLLFEARARIRANPKKYVNHVYGENEVGGTSWLYVSDVPFELLGFKKNLPSYPLPSLTDEVVSRIPAVVVALTALLGVLGVTLTRPGKSQETGP